MALNTVPGLSRCPINAVSSILFLAFSYPLSLETWPYLSVPLSPSDLDQRSAMWVHRARGQCTLLGTLTAPAIISSSNSGALTPLLLGTLVLPVLEIGALPPHCLQRMDSGPMGHSLGSSMAASSQASCPPTPGPPWHSPDPENTEDTSFGLERWDSQPTSSYQVEAGSQALCPGLDTACHMVTCRGGHGVPGPTSVGPRAPSSSLPPGTIAKASSPQADHFPLSAGCVL